MVELLPHYDLVILNFANPDMVGHTGVVEAASRPWRRSTAACARWSRKTLVARRPAPHHRRSRQLRADAQPRRLARTPRTPRISSTSSTSPPTPQKHRVESGILADVAPTLLALLGLAAAARDDRPQPRPRANSGAPVFRCGDGAAELELSPSMPATTAPARSSVKLADGVVVAQGSLKPLV